MTQLSRDEWILLRQRVLEKEFSRMNQMQRQAVFTTEGPLLVLAGAGSGKTTVLVNRIAGMVRYGTAYHSDYLSPYLTDEDEKNCRAYLDGGELPVQTRERLAVDACAAWRVMAITFTNKAAGELKERLCAMLGGDEGEKIWASTFHSSCARMLRRDGDRLGYSSHFTIYDSDDSRRLMKECLKALDISEKALTPKAVLGEISRAKDSLRGPVVYEQEAGDDFRLKLVARAYKAYQQRLKEAGAMDFDDLIVNTVKLFETCPDVLEYYQQRFRYIMVDEYQDTNHAQFMLVSLLASRHKNLCVVGDDDQSIYKFRGADITNILDFEKQFENAAVIRLEKNYRSTQTILDAANSLIANNVRRKGKNLWTDNGKGTPIQVYRAADEMDEAQIICEQVLEHVRNGASYGDHVVLYRTNAQSNSVELAMKRSGIATRIIGGLRFFERKEIKDIIAYLSVLNNPNDSLRLRRIINEPKRGIGDSTVAHAQEIAEQLGTSLFEVVSTADQYADLVRKSAGLISFSRMIKDLTELSEDEPLDELVELILEKTGYQAMLQNQGFEGQTRMENIMELKTNIVRYMEENEDPDLAGFLEEVALYTDLDNFDPGADAVVMMTLHSAKGLEFPYVFIAGMDEGLFPSRQAMFDPVQVEEERRLAYVGVTRAKKGLTLLGAAKRLIFGQTTYSKMSRFIKEISPELVEMEDRTLRASRAAETAPAARKKGITASSTEIGVGRRESVGSMNFSVGESVRHKVFGQGMVLDVRSMGGDTLLEVAFDKVGTKKLMANFAKLTKIQS